MRKWSSRTPGAYERASGIPRYVWNAEDLKNESAGSDDSNRVLVINATVKGGEILARAWCLERGKNAVIRRIWVLVLYAHTTLPVWRV